MISWQSADLVQDAEAGCDVRSGESHEHSCRYLHLHKPQFHNSFLERGGQEGVKSDGQPGPDWYLMKRLSRPCGLVTMCTVERMASALCHQNACMNSLTWLMLAPLFLADCMYDISMCIYTSDSRSNNVKLKYRLPHCCVKCRMHCI